MRRWTVIVGAWALADGAVLALFPKHVEVFQALLAYFGGTGGRTAWGLLLTGFFGVGTLCMVAATLNRSDIIAVALGATLTFTIVWAAIGLVVTFHGYDDWGRLTLYAVWILTQAASLRFAWVMPEDETRLRETLRDLRQQRRRLESARRHR